MVKPANIFIKTIPQAITLLFLLIICGCKDLIIQPATSNRNLEDFEAAWKRVDDVYPFLGLKHIDWDSIYSVYRPRVLSARGDEFYVVLGDFIAELKDGHAYYKTEGGDEVYPFYPMRHFRDRHAYSPIVVRKYFPDKLLLTTSKSAEYGITADNIGYVFLAGFQEDHLQHEFPGIIQYMKQTRGLIIDIRQKRGGNYENAQAVVAPFLSLPMEKPALYFLGVLVRQSPLEPLAVPLRYTQSVVVLINGSTFSAGEVTTEMLKQVPNVTVIGDTTGGGGVASDDGSSKTAAEFVLPSGKIICVGSGYLARYDGLPFESIGIEPDIRVEQTAQDINDGHDKQLEYALQFFR